MSSSCFLQIVRPSSRSIKYIHLYFCQGEIVETSVKYLLCSNERNTENQVENGQMGMNVHMCINWDKPRCIFLIFNLCIILLFHFNSLLFLQKDVPERSSSLDSSLSPS